MALKKLKWLKYLFVNRTEAETEQNYWNEKRKRHIANEHKEGVVVGLGVTEANPPSLSIVVQGGRAIDTEGNDPEVETAQEIDFTSLVPPSGTLTVYLKLSFNEVEVEPYFVDEIGDYQNKYVQDTSVLEATTEVPIAPDLELARIELGAGASEITDAADPLNPGINEIDLRYRKDSTVFVMALQDLTDVDPDEADAFNNMNSPSAGNPVATLQDVVDGVAPVESEVQDARGSQASLDDRLDVMLNEDGSFKGITGIAPSAPLTGGGSAGSIPIGIDLATPTSDGAMSAADKSNLDANTAHSTGDGSDHSEVAANSGHRGTTTGNPHQISHDDLVGTMPPDAHHARDHGIDSAADHNGVSVAIEDNLMAFNAAGLPKDSLLSALHAKKFDAIIMREDYSSDAAAGTALKNALENTAVQSIYVGECPAGQWYQFPDGSPITQADAQLVLFESDARCRWSVTSLANDSLELLEHTIIIGGQFSVEPGGLAGQFGLVVVKNHTTVIGSYIHDVPGIGMMGSYSAYHTEVSNIVGVECRYCTGGPANHGGFYKVRGLTNCRSYDNYWGFEQCYYISGCLAVSNTAHGYYESHNIVSSTAYGNQVGFSSCKEVSGCTSLYNTTAGFASCWPVSGCWSYENPTGFTSCLQAAGCFAQMNTGHGFSACNCAACYSDSNDGDGFWGCQSIVGGYAANNGGDGVDTCSRISGVWSINNGSAGFRSCSYISASVASGNTAANWTGNSFKDADSCN